jgi:CRP-like cAMP-binding protein
VNSIRTSDLEKMELFSNVERGTLKALSEIGIKRIYKKGEHIFRDKEKVSNLYIVKSGKVALYKLSESAQKKIIFILGENKVINAVILDNLPASINCEAFEDAEILSFDIVKFVEIMKNNFELTKIIINSLTIKVRRLYRQSKNSIAIKVEKRVAAKLWKLSKDYGVEVKNGTLINLNVSVTYLADMFGAQRETISRALKILVNKGLILNENKKIIIVNREKLAEFFKGND